MYRYIEFFNFHQRARLAGGRYFGSIDKTLVRLSSVGAAFNLFMCRPDGALNTLTHFFYQYIAPAELFIISSF
jgi:hypothetical protein